MLAFLPTLVLLLVALHQRRRIRTAGQTAWKGGGFGMFSDIDRNSVAATLWVIDQSGSRACPIDPSPAQSRVTNIPTDPNVFAWGRELARLQWQQCGGTVHPHIAATEARTARIERIELRRLRLDFLGRDGRYSADHVRTYVVTPQQEGPCDR